MAERFLDCGHACLQGFPIQSLSTDRDFFGSQGAFLRTAVA